MKTKRIAGIVIFILGLAMLFASNYIMNQVNAGKVQVADAQKKVDQGNQLFSLNPVAKEVGKGLTGQVQKKINAGEEEIAQYQRLAGQLKIGGIIALVLGVVIFLLGRKKK